MSIDIILILMLFGHIVGDFYLQSNRLVSRKIEKFSAVLLHSIIYLLAVAGLLFLVIQYSLSLLLSIIFIITIHIAIDSLTRIIHWKPFIIDQLLHIASLIAAWLIWGNTLVSKDFVLWNFNFIPSTPAVTVILGLLLLLKPISLLISSGDIWDFSKNVPGESQKGAGKMIGYLERFIIYLLLIFGQYTAIGFIITAKTIVRFPEISKNIEISDENYNKNKSGRPANSLAEYYLIGTLLSMVSTFVVYLLFV